MNPHQWEESSHGRVSATFLLPGFLSYCGISLSCKPPPCVTDGWVLCCLNSRSPNLGACCMIFFPGEMKTKQNTTEKRNKTKQKGPATHLWGSPATQGKDRLACWSTLWSWRVCSGHDHMGGSQVSATLKSLTHLGWELRKAVHWRVQGTYCSGSVVCLVWTWVLVLTSKGSWSQR